MERLVILWCPGLSREGPRGEELRHFSALLDIVAERCPFVEPIRLGMAALPARAPSRFFGGEEAVLELLRGDLAALIEQVGTSVHLGIADGLFPAVLAARRGAIVPAGESRSFLAPHSVATLRRPELAALCQRLGLGTLGRFAELDHARVLERFGSDGAHCHRVARAEEGELEGIRERSIHARLSGLDEPAPVPQPSFFGGTSLADERAARAAIRLQRRLGPEGVQVAHLCEGHDPTERAVLVPFGSRTPQAPRSSHASAPWPGHLPAPSPARVLKAPPLARVVDRSGAAVALSSRGLLTAAPRRVAVLPDGPDDEVVAWAGPWPLVTRWWDRRRARGRLQVVTAAGVGMLLVAERGEWRLHGRYD